MPVQHYERVLLLLIGLFLFSESAELMAQRSVRRAKQNLRELRQDNWPPERAHSRVSLGYALQNVFQKHYNYCGFAPREGRRDYIPADINRFLGRRTLRTRVELADISGGSLLQYVFAGEELETPLNVIRYNPRNLLAIDTLVGRFLLDPDERFDAFVLTKNCAGYLKSALDAGIEPPYSAFRTALDVDDRRESSVVAVSGSFVSPLADILEARDAGTTDLMLQLWQFYQRNPEYIGQAYYLRAFEGVMIKHLATANDVTQLESEVGININIPLAGRIKGNTLLGRQTSGNFQGTDWETIVYADFAGPYGRRSLYAPLPGPAEISAYFDNLRPSFRKDPNFPMLTEGADHSHYLVVEGIPKEICRQPWVIESLEKGVYDRPPALTVNYFENADGSYGCRFTVTGRPERKLFRGSRRNRPGQARLQYKIRSQYPVGGQYLSFSVDAELPTSAHPTVALGQGNFDLSMQEDRRFAFQWRTILEIEDADNPIDFATRPRFEKIRLLRGEEVLEVEVVKISPLPARHHYELVLETRSTYPLMEIDDRNLLNYDLNMEVYLKSKRSNSEQMRPVRGTVSFPGIRAPEPEPTVEPAPSTIPPLAPVKPKSGGN